MHVAAANSHKAFGEWALSTLSTIEEVRSLVNAQDSDGDTPLHNAFLSGGTEFAEWLKDNHADAFIKNNAGNNALYNAMLYEQMTGGAVPVPSWVAKYEAEHNVRQSPKR